MRYINKQLRALGIDENNLLYYYYPNVYTTLWVPNNFLIFYQTTYRNSKNER